MLHRYYTFVASSCSLLASFFAASKDDDAETRSPCLPIENKLEVGEHDGMDKAANLSKLQQQQ